MASLVLLLLTLQFFTAAGSTSMTWTMYSSSDCDGTPVMLESHALDDSGVSCTDARCEAMEGADGTIFYRDTACDVDHFTLADAAFGSATYVMYDRYSSEDCGTFYSSEAYPVSETCTLDPYGSHIVTMHSDGSATFNIYLYTFACEDDSTAFNYEIDSVDFSGGTCIGNSAKYFTNSAGGSSSPSKSSTSGAATSSQASASKGEGSNGSTNTPTSSTSGTETSGPDSTDNQSLDADQSSSTAAGDITVESSSSGTGTVSGRGGSATSRGAAENGEGGGTDSASNISSSGVSASALVTFVAGVTVMVIA